MIKLTRRQALLLPASLSLGTRGYASTPQDRVRIPAIVDSSESVAKTVHELRARGVKAIFRYYALAKQPGLPTKIISPDEKDEILAAGMALGIAFQYYNNDLNTFTSSRGKADALKVLEYGLNVIHQPVGSAVYFGVDGDWPDAVSMRKVTNYFEHLNREFEAAGRPYSIGVYGSGFTCNHLKRAGLATLFWVAKSIGFTGTRQFFNSHDWHLYQNMLEVPIGSLRVDTDWLNPSRRDCGLFDANGKVVIEADPAVYKERRFVGADRLPVLDQPRSDARAVTSLRRGENVVVSHEVKGWASIILGEDMMRRGFCQSEHLKKVTDMP